MSALRSDRESVAEKVAMSKDHFRELLEHALHPDPEIAKKACWVLELVVLENPELLRAAQKKFFEVLDHAGQGSMIRPLAKIIAHWCAEVAEHPDSPYPSLSLQEQERLTSLCFSWLISGLPVAVKVHSMEALFHLGKTIPWIHPELQEHLLKDYSASSPAFKARARKLLKALEGSRRQKP